jgi:hypothetical protein
MEHDSPGLLFTVTAEYRISAKTIRPGWLRRRLRRQTHDLPARAAGRPHLRRLHTPGYQRPIHLSTDRSQPSRHPHLPRTTRAGAATASASSSGSAAPVSHDPFACPVTTLPQCVSGRLSTRTAGVHTSQFCRHDTQISLICRRLGRHCHALVSAPIGGYLRAGCRPCATVRDGSRTAATAGRSRRGEHPGARVSMGETLIGGACQQPQFAK